MFSIIATRMFDIYIVFSFNAVCVRYLLSMYLLCLIALKSACKYLISISVLYMCICLMSIWYHQCYAFDIKQ